MRFEPPYCPYEDCEAHCRAPFSWRRRGTYRRKVDGRDVQRFECLHCHRRLSTQTFRVDYRLRLPRLHFLVFQGLVSKTTLRQMARNLGVTRWTVEHRLELLGRHCREFHEDALRIVAASGGLMGTWLLDEQESFETHRKLKPLTTPVLIEGRSGYLLHHETAPLPPRRPLTPREQAQLARVEAVEGRRRSGSKKAVQACFDVLAKVVAPIPVVTIHTDKKRTYPGCIRRALGDGVRHEQTHSRRPRCTSNPLFRINHTLAMLRDGVSRLVRRNWGASKMAKRHARHLWVWTAYKNYVRPMTNKHDRVGGLTPAMALGVETKRWKPVDLLRWRVGPTPPWE